MDIVITTTPIRPIPTTYPPFGSLAVIQSLRRAGYDPYFYDIDALRPDFDAVVEFFRARKPDVLGVSAVVSTAYGYVKRLVREVRRVSPDTRIVVGGNLAASAEILHRLVGVDVCVVGEGEVVSVNLMRAFERSKRRVDADVLGQVRGLTFLDDAGQMVFTGYELQIPAVDVFDPDFGILEKYSRVSTFITDIGTRPDFLLDERSSQPHRKGKKMGTLVTAKGCVARCTFCHRWDKGYRAVPVEQIIAKVRELQTRYDVGFVQFTDENFGSDRRHTEELVRRLKELDILWNVGGVRVRSADPGLLKRMREAGCVSVFYGMETGSPTILKVMEKKAELKDNLNAARWTREAGLFTIYQMVLGMPGECDRTIRETTEFLKAVTQDQPYPPRSLMSLNYIQALPGTPVYEFARAKGLIGASLADEERYLLSISDIDAQDDAKMLNFTESDYLTVRSWRRRIVLEVMRHYHEHNRTPTPPLASFLASVAKRRLWEVRDHNEPDEAKRREVFVSEYSKGGYFNLSRDLGYDVIVAYFHPIRSVIVAAWLLRQELRTNGLAETLRDVRAWIMGRLAPARRPDAEPVSLRETVMRLAPKPSTPTETAMQPLRDGR